LILSAIFVVSFLSDQQLSSGQQSLFLLMRAFLLTPVKKYPVLDGEKVPIVGRLGNTHLDILPFFPSDF
jgi:hypothetical protein